MFGPRERKKRFPLLARPNPLTLPKQAISTIVCVFSLLVPLRGQVDAEQAYIGLVIPVSLIREPKIPRIRGYPVLVWLLFGIK